MDTTLSPTFTDNKGDMWDLTLNFGTIEDINDIASINLDDMLQHPEKMAELLLQKPAKLVEMLWIVCEDQAKARELTPRMFGKRFTRDVIDNAVNSFLMAIVLFYPRASAGRMLAERLPQILQTMDKAIAEGTKAIMHKGLLNTDTGLPVSSVG